MVSESRVKKSLKNARVNLTFYFLTLILSFFSRKIFLDTLGADFVGLTTTLQNMLGFLNLAELGISTAIGYVLYKPLFEHDEGKINEIISVFGYLYRWIGLIILGAGIILACFLPLIFPESGFDLGLIYFAYSAFLISSLIGYFINYRQTLLGADQKNYVVTACYQSVSIIKILIQMASAYYTGNYYLWVAIELTFGILYSIVLNRRINKVYPWLKSEVKLGKKLFSKYPDVWKYTKQLFVHKINSFFQYQVTPILIYSFVSLKTVAFYGNYTIIIDKVFQLLNTVLSSVVPGVGNLIAEGNNKKIISVFWELMFVRFWIAGVVTFCLFFLMEPFISIWIGETYILPRVILGMILIRIFLQLTNDSVSDFLFGYGLFADVWASIAQTLIFLISAIVGGHFIGLKGILLAGIISLILIRCIWKPYYLYKEGFKLPVIYYWVNYLKYCIITGISFYISHTIINLYKYNLNNHNLLKFLLYIIIVCITFMIVNTLLFILFNKTTRQFLYRFLNANK